MLNSKLCVYEVFTPPPPPVYLFPNERMFPLPPPNPPKLPHIVLIFP